MIFQGDGPSRQNMGHLNLRVTQLYVFLGDVTNTCSGNHTCAVLWDAMELVLNSDSLSEKFKQLAL